MAANTLLTLKRVRLRPDIIVVKGKRYKNVRKRSQEMINSPQQNPEDDFEQAANYVLQKNKTLYERLA